MTPVNAMPPLSSAQWTTFQTEVVRKPDDLLNFPVKIQLQTFDRCNYVCPMRSYPATPLRREKYSMPTVLFRKMLADNSNCGRRAKLRLVLQNEPLLDARFLELLDEARAVSAAILSVSTVTNGTVLTDAGLDRIMTYDRFFLTVSVNAIHSSRYLWVHGQNSLEWVHGCLGGWQGQRGLVRLSFVPDASAIEEEARRFQSFWHGLGYATRLMPINSRNGEFAIDRIHEFEPGYGRCHYPVDTLNVLKNGCVIHCCADWVHNCVHGDLSSQTKSQVWNGPELTSMRKAAIEGTLRNAPMCRRCDYPIGSSQRGHLEAAVAGSSVVQPAHGAPFTTNLTRLRFNNVGTVPSLIWNLNPAQGPADGIIPGESRVCKIAWFEMRIGHSGAFNFGSLEPAWREESRSWRRVEHFSHAEVNIDRSGDAYQFFAGTAPTGRPYRAGLANTCQTPLAPQSAAREIIIKKGKKVNQ